MSPRARGIEGVREAYRGRPRRTEGVRGVPRVSEGIYRARAVTEPLSEEYRLPRAYVCILPGRPGADLEPPPPPPLGATGRGP